MTKTLTEFTSTRKRNGVKTLVAYVTAGLDGWVDVVHAACEAGADIVEVGLPFSDPVMDGPVIAHASAVALRSGAKTLPLLEEIANEKFSSPTLIMTYTNVLAVHGVTEIVHRLSAAHISGLILPDLTYEQSDLFHDALSSTDISLVQLISSTTSVQRRQRILDACEGFLYCIAIKGITGSNVDVARGYTEFIGEIERQSPLPTYCGVGVRTPDDAHALSRLCDGVIVGTSVVEKMLDNSQAPQDVAALIGDMRAAIDS